MKKSFFILIISICLLKCDTATNPNVTSKGYYKIGTDTYNLDYFHLDAYVNKPSDSIKEYLICFSEKPYSQTSIGSDKEIRCNLFAPNISYLDSGTYIQETPVDTAKFKVCNGYLNAFASAGTQTLNSYDLVNSQFKFSKSGNIYTVDFSGVLTNFKEFSGHFEGQFDSF